MLRRFMQASEWSRETSRTWHEMVGDCGEMPEKRGCWKGRCFGLLALTRGRGNGTLARRTKGEYEHCCGASKTGGVGTGGAHSRGLVDAPGHRTGAGFLRDCGGRCGTGRRISAGSDHGVDGDGFLGAHGPGARYPGRGDATRRELRLCGCLGFAGPALGGGPGGGSAPVALGARRKKQGWRRCGGCASRRDGRFQLGPPWRIWGTRRRGRAEPGGKAAGAQGRGQGRWLVSSAQRSTGPGSCHRRVVPWAAGCSARQSGSESPGRVFGLYSALFGIDPP